MDTTTPTPIQTDKPLKPVEWANGRLYPVGTLTPVKVEIQDSNHIVNPVVHCIDESGVLWDVSHVNLKAEMWPISFPQPLRACYHFVRKGTYGTHRDKVTADSKEEAVAKLRAVHYYWEPDTIVFERVTKPQPD